MAEIESVSAKIRPIHFRIFNKEVAELFASQNRAKKRSQTNDNEGRFIAQCTLARVTVETHIAGEGCHKRLMHSDHSGKARTSNF